MKWLIPFLFLFTAAQADSITTGNLLPNAGDGVDWGSTSTEQINPGSSSGTVVNGANVNGFDVTCPASQANCGYKYSVGGDFEVTGTATLSANDIALTNNNRTQEMLDNGITLNSYIDVANCDSQPGNCEGKTGNADSHTVTIQLKDSSGNVLSTTTQTRTEIVGFQGNCNGYPSSNSGGQAANCGQYNDQVIYNNHGSNNVDWSWSGTDNNTGSGQRGGPNLLGAALTMTYDDTILDTNTSTALGDVQDTLGDLQEDVFDDVQEFFFEEETFTFNEEPQFEMEMPMEMEMDTFQFAEEFIEEFFMEFEPEFIMEPEGMTMEEGPIVMFADDVMMEEVYEESNEIVATFLPVMSPEEEEMIQEKPPMMTDTFQEEEMIEEEPPIMTESFPQEEMIQEKPAMMTESFQEEEMIEEEMIEEDMLEEPTEMAEEEMIEEEPTEMAKEESVEEKPTKMVQAKNEKKEVKEKKLVSKTAKKSAVQTKKIKEQKAIQQKKALVKNLTRVMEKVDEDIKDISKNLQIKNIIKLQAMTSQQESLDQYQATSFYKPKDIYLDQLNLVDNRLIYADKSLATYIQNDKMDIKARKLQEIRSRKQKILMELEVLKNG
jgi:hypothetical protein